MGQNEGLLGKMGANGVKWEKWQPNGSKRGKLRAKWRQKRLKLGSKRGQVGKIGGKMGIKCG